MTPTERPAYPNPSDQRTRRSPAVLAGYDDSELTALANAGDQVALDVLLQRHVDLVYAVCRRITGSDHDAADAAQNALIAVVRGLARFDGSSRFTTWVFRIATNASLDELRRRRRRPDPVDLASTRPSAEPGAGRLDEQVAAGVDVDRALAGLPPDYRAAVVLRDLCGLDYAEIAEILGIPGGTVRSRIARGRSALVDLVGGNPEERRRRQRGDDG